MELVTKKKTNELVNTLIRILLILSIIFLLMIPFASFILNAIGTPVEFIEEGTNYFRVLIVATIVNFVNLIFINVEKSRGRTGVIMIANFSMMMLKFVLTALFIYVLDKGIIYIALATLITYSACAIYALPRLFDKKKHLLHPHFKSPSYQKRICKITYRDIMSGCCRGFGLLSWKGDCKLNRSFIWS